MNLFELRLKIKERQPKPTYVVDRALLEAEGTLPPGGGGGAGEVPEGGGAFSQTPESSYPHSTFFCRFRYI